MFILSSGFFVESSEDIFVPRKLYFSSSVLPHVVYFRVDDINILTRSDII